MGLEGCKGKNFNLKITNTCKNSPSESQFFTKDLQGGMSINSPGKGVSSGIRRKKQFSPSSGS